MASRSDDQRAARASHRAARAAAQRRAERRRKLTIVGTVVAGALVVIGLVALAVRSSSPSKADASAVTSVSGFDLHALDGPGRVRLADFRGEPTVVNFFASWCTECDRELPGFRRAVDKYKGKVHLVFVNSNDTGDGEGMARDHDLLAQPVARDTSSNGLYRSLGGTGGMPITVFYDANGNLVNRSFGALVGSDLDNAIATTYGKT